MLLLERDAGGVGIADGPFAATLAARRSLDRAGSPPVVVVPGGSPAFLAPHPVSVLANPGPASAELVDVWARLGLRRLSDVAALAGTDVVGRFGVEGLVAYQLASGDDAHPPHLREPPVP